MRFRAVNGAKDGEIMIGNWCDIMLIIVLMIQFMVRFVIDVVLNIYIMTELLM